MPANIDRDYLLKLAYKKKTASLNENEEKILNDWYDAHPDELLRFPEEEKSSEAESLNRILVKSLAEAKRLSGHKNRIRNRIRWAVAAMILVILSIGLTFMVRGLKGSEKDTLQMSEVKPGGSRAILTLADGHHVDLSAAMEGRIALEEGIQIIKTNQGLEYHQPKSVSGQSATPKINELKTPRGGEFVITLSDGTKVWLNASSSLRFPDHFAGSERTVEISGEAYFEVSHDLKHPFKVKHRNHLVEVLGTHFNVNTYEDEPAGITTTLAEGRVKVTTPGGQRYLSPGEQSRVMSDGGIEVTKADISASLAWKNGLLSFKDADLPTIMRQLSRWYDVQIQFNGSAGERRFSGGFPKNAPLSTILEILQASNIKFSLHEQQGEKVLTVTPQ